MSDQIKKKSHEELAEDQSHIQTSKNIKKADDVIRKNREKSKNG